MRTLIAATVAAALVLGADVAHADDGIDSAICNQLALGQSPGQIAGELHDGNATITRQRATQRVWESLGGCPDD